MSKEDFKAFVKSKPDLVDRVHQGEFSWQELYEAYDLYGENAPVFKSKVTVRSLPVEHAKIGNPSWKEFSELLKSVDLETVQKGVNGLQKAVSLLQDLGSFKEPSKKVYEERPIYKYYED